MDIRCRSQPRVDDLIDLDELLAERETGFGQLSAGEINAPERNET